MMTQHISRIRSGKALRSEADFDAMWREMAQTERQGWSIAHEPLQGLYALWEPRLELRETEDAYLLRAALPEMQRDDISVEYRDGGLTIRGEQRVSSHPERQQTRLEHGYRAFTRRFVLSEPVAAEAMAITYTPDGLEVTLPKAVPAAALDIPLLAAS
ncbi:MAG: Hsp20/alpha crystallin family protein [Candidatus Tectimicrobiota bacterium]